MCHYQKTLSKGIIKTEYLEHSANVDKISTKEEKKTRKPVTDGIEAKKKKKKKQNAEQEYQTLKPRGKGCKRNLIE